jgi:hypothetical protein
MKNFMTTITSKTPVVFLLALAIAGCAEKSTGTKTVNNYITNPITGTSGTGTVTGGATGTCDGIARGDANITDCYFKDLPLIILSGSGVNTGSPYWSSASASGFSQENLRSDGTFTVRIKPLAIEGGGTSNNLAGSRTCSQWTNLNFTKMKVVLRLKSVEGGYSDLTLTSEVGSASPKGSFNLPPTIHPYKLEVMSVLTNHRCKEDTYGTLTSTQRAACNTGTFYYDIPVVTTTANPTECVSLKIEYATDYTYDLPN